MLLSAAQGAKSDGATLSLGAMGIGDFSCPSSDEPPFHAQKGRRFGRFPNRPVTNPRLSATALLNQEQGHLALISLQLTGDHSPNLSWIAMALDGSRNLSRGWRGP